MSRCTGHCCQVVELGWSALDALTSPEKDAQDGDQIRAMLQFVEWVDGRGAVFTCRNFDGKDCLDYAGRPRMCKDYPYGQKCPRTGCTYDPSGHDSALLPVHPSPA